MEMPVFAAGIAHSTPHRGAIDAQYWCNRQRLFERRFDQQARIARGGQKMANGTTIPFRPRGYRGCRLRKQIGRGRERKSGGGGTAQKFATGRHWMKTPSYGL